MDIPVIYEEPKHRLLQSYLVNGLLFTLQRGTSERMIVYKTETETDNSFRLWSVLVRPTSSVVLSDDVFWNVGPDHQYGPKIVRQEYKGREFNHYIRFGFATGERPLVLHRVFEGFGAEYLELDQEFCLFHKLYEDKKHGVFVAFAVADRIIEVANIAEGEVTIKSDYVNRYLAALGMCLVIFIDSTRRIAIPSKYVEQQVRDRKSRGGQLTWERKIVEETSSEGSMMVSRLRAKAVIHPPSMTQSGIWPAAVQKASSSPMSQSRSRNTEPRQCPRCGDEDHQIRNGVTEALSQRYRCQKCGYSYTPDPKQRGYSEETKRSALILRSNGFSYGRIAKRLRVHRTTVIKWVKTHSSGPED